MIFPVAVYLVPDSSPPGDPGTYAEGSRRECLGFLSLQQRRRRHGLVHAPVSPQKTVTGFCGCPKTEKSVMQRCMISLSPPEFPPSQSFLPLHVAFKCRRTRAETDPTFSGSLFKDLSLRVCRFLIIGGLGQLVNCEAEALDGL